MTSKTTKASSNLSIKLVKTSITGFKTPPTSKMTKDLILSHSLVNLSQMRVPLSFLRGSGLDIPNLSVLNATKADRSTQFTLAVSSKKKLIKACKTKRNQTKLPIFAFMTPRK